MTFALLNKLTAKPGKRQQVIDILLEAGTLFDDNPACLLSLTAESGEDANVVWVVDLWTSKEEHENALQVPEMRPFVEKSLPLLEGRPEQTEIRPVGGKGVSG